MAEAEEVLADAALHATNFARGLWHRHRKGATAEPEISLREMAQRLDILLSSVFGKSYPIRIAQPPAPATFLTKVLRRDEGPRAMSAIPATDDTHLWLPARSMASEAAHALAQYRVLALQQATRAHRGSAQHGRELSDALEMGAYLVLEAQAADGDLIRLLPGTRRAVVEMRSSALRARPPLSAFPAYRKGLEQLVRLSLARDPANDAPSSARDSREHAREIARELRQTSPPKAPDSRQLFKDLWTGELRVPPAEAPAAVLDADKPDDASETKPRSARLSRAPQVRTPAEDEDDKKPGAWMVQSSVPHEQVEDPAGMQRPTDRDDATASEEMADALSELPEARLVTAPGRPKDVFLSDEPVTSRARVASKSESGSSTALHYAEWDYRIGAYGDAGVTVHVKTMKEGPQEWVDRTLDGYRTMVNLVRRRFEMLRAQRMRLRKQLEGDEVDIDAYIEGRADFQAGLPMPEAIYQTYREARRDMAILLLVDVSGSTDGWISAYRSVMDVEREALLLVSIALQGLHEPCCVLAFSGEGPHGVKVHTVKAFEEEFGPIVSRRIAALEPEHYTRAGAAIRHASAMLMAQGARHRLLLMLSDGKPNDIDVYEGRYGVEDMRQAVVEARLQGIDSFCLTVDRQAANYLPGVFGVGQYALLPRPELLPTVLLDWMRRLVQS